MSLFDFGDQASPLELAFWDFHGENPHVYELVKRFALEATGKGRTRLSINLLFERIRWYTTIETSGEFKLNNNHRAYYARLWLRDHPEHPDFFATRRQKVESSI